MYEFPRLFNWFILDIRKLDFEFDGDRVCVVEGNYVKCFFNWIEL